MYRWSLYGYGLAIAILVGTTLGAIAAVVFRLPESPTSSSSLVGLHYRLARSATILVSGVDDTAEEADPFAGLSDTLLLLHFDRDRRSLFLLSIPRDTRVWIPDVGDGKINEANRYGAEVAVATVEELLDVSIDGYVRLATDGFRELIDAIGGVEVQVDAPMQYRDRAAGLTIDLEPGWQTLNGMQAEQFARFRQDEFGDIGRVQRQQALLQSLRQRLAHPTVLPHLAAIIRITRDDIDTDLSVEERMALLRFSLAVEPEGLEMVLLPGRASDPGEYSTRYWLVDEEERDRLVDRYFQPHGSWHRH